MRQELLWRNYRLWLRPKDVREIVDEGGAANTDDKPFIEFAAARNI